jgi:hypothetical protein
MSWAKLGWGVLLIGLVGGGLLVEWERRGRHKKPEGPDMAGWDITRLMRHLNGRGLELRRLSTNPAGTSINNAYLTTTAMTGEETQRLWKMAERIDDWHGVVYCEKISDPECRAEQRAFWADCYFERGPFRFFGDPKLLDRIHAALTDES